MRSVEKTTQWRGGCGGGGGEMTITSNGIWRSRNQTAALDE